MKEEIIIRFRPETMVALREFINAVETLAHSVSSVCGTNCLSEIYEASEKLKQELEKEPKGPK